jgi:hypothetical protein
VTEEIAKAIGRCHGSKDIRKLMERALTWARTRVDVTIFVSVSKTRFNQKAALLIVFISVAWIFGDSQRTECAFCEEFRNLSESIQAACFIRTNYDPGGWVQESHLR